MAPPTLSEAIAVKVPGEQTARTHGVQTGVLRTPCGGTGLKRAVIAIPLFGKTLRVGCG